MFAGAEVVHRYYRPDLVSAEAVDVALLRAGGSAVELLWRKVSGLDREK